MNDRKFRVKDNWKVVYGSKKLADWMNDVGRLLNNIQVVRGGDCLVTAKGIFLRVKSQAVTIPSLWDLYQEPEDIPGLRISMLPGVLVRTAASSLYPLNTLVNYTPANAPDDATTMYWLKASVSKSAYQSYFEVWTVDSFEVASGAAVPADTLDIPGDTAGDLHFKIGEVTTVDGEVTDIQQDLSAPVTIVFPLGVIVDEFECPDGEEE